MDSSLDKGLWKKSPSYLGYVLGDILLLGLWLFSDNELLSSAVIATIGAQMLGIAIGKFIQSKNIGYLIMSILLLLLVVWQVIEFFQI